MLRANSPVGPVFNAAVMGWTTVLRYSEFTIHTKDPKIDNLVRRDQRKFDI